ncbi:AraC family transcriptional regulator [Kineosporia succinea]|uniref:AraC-like DNA-binding protein n=1 Tax=Kineosporia succinea TaxID=84632 RepID=A0ABT9NVF3_9ACTN|nr:AraC family transcriptional regulator [Kineosporia succinea]MDP9824411.1 AraC-like DNA-binding protein [Kineosporia succinea]
MTSLDRISPLLRSFRVSTSVFHTGPLCGVTTFAARPGRGFLHVLRRGEMTVTHQEPGGRLVHLPVDRPTLLFYPRPLEHAFHNAPTEDSDFACAALDFDGGETHPIVRALPPVIVLPLADVSGLDPALQLLFGEIDQVRCGHRLVADRLFEVVLIQLLRWLLDHAGELGLPPGLFTGLSDPRLAPVLLGMHESPERDWNLDTMAREARMSRSAFADRFRKLLGQAPGEYLTHWRLTVAQQRLLAGVPVATVAAQLGYANASSFSRVFTQHLGSSPRGWVTVQAQAGSLDGAQKATSG